MQWEERVPPLVPLLPQPQHEEVLQMNTPGGIGEEATSGAPCLRSFPSVRVLPSTGFPAGGALDGRLGDEAAPS